jgi:5' nucleotidase family
MLAVDGEFFNKRWGYLSRSGLNDKSQFTRQIEKYADIYTSRVSNFLRYTVSSLAFVAPANLLCNWLCCAHLLCFAVPSPSAYPSLRNWRSATNPA